MEELRLDLRRSGKDPGGFQIRLRQCGPYGYKTHCKSHTWDLVMTMTIKNDEES